MSLYFIRTFMATKSKVRRKVVYQRECAVEHQLLQGSLTFIAIWHNYRLKWRIVRKI